MGHSHVSIQIVIVKSFLVFKYTYYHVGHVVTCHVLREACVSWSDVIVMALFCHLQGLLIALRRHSNVPDVHLSKAKVSYCVASLES